MSTEEKVGQLIGEIRLGLLNQFDDRAEGFLSDCESPIERLFMVSLLAAGLTSPFDADAKCAAYRKATEPLGAVFQGDDYWSALLAVLVVNGAADTPIVTAQQRVSIADRDMRIDFVFVGNEGGCAAVELDGHDFHERTKEQAARDKSRDRLLTAAGWRVLRFTGSEVYANPHECVRESFKSLRSGRLIA